MESLGKDGGRQHKTQYHQTTPVSRKPTRSQQNHRHTQRQTQHHWDLHVPSYVPQGFQNSLRGNFSPHYPPQQQHLDRHNLPRQNQHNNGDFCRRRQSSQYWTSTPRDPNFRQNFPNSQSLFGETSANNSLLNILDTQRQVQHETTQALSKIIQLQDTWANDTFLSDLPVFAGDPKEFLDWILKVEKVSKLTGRSEQELATAKADGAVFKCLSNIPPHSSWEDCKKSLRENFSNLQTRRHTQSYLLNRMQRQDETLHVYIHLFTQLARILTGLEPRAITEDFYVTVFNKNLYNKHIKRFVCKHSPHQNLQAAFDDAYAAEAQAKKLEGLNDSVSVMKVEAEADINYVQTGTKQFSANQADANKTPHFRQYNQGKPKGPCYKCFEYGHLAYECSKKGTTSSIYPKYSDHLKHIQLVASDKPPKVTNSVITDSQLSILLTKMQEMETENRKMKDFVKQRFLQSGKQASGPDRTTSSGTQGNKPPNPFQQKQTPTKTTVNKIDFDATEDDSSIPSGILELLGYDPDETLRMEQSQAVTDTVNINVVLTTDATMASEFRVSIRKEKSTGLFDSGASHSCMSNDCFMATMPQASLSEASHISVKNASGKSMEPMGICHTTIVLGPKSFKHSFIVCRHLTSSLILGLDFSSQHRIGTDWTHDGRMYLHQGKQKLIEGTVSTMAVKRPRLVMKTQVNLPLRTIGIVPVQVTQGDFIQPNRVYESIPDSSFESQYPVTTIPLIHHISEEQNIVACIINPTEFTIPIQADKTVQEIREVPDNVSINKLLVTNNASDALPTKLEAFDKDFTGTVMPGDFSPHQKFSLDYDKTRDKKET